MHKGYGQRPPHLSPCHQLVTAVGSPSYLSLCCRISLPFFQRLEAGGDAWGWQSSDTWLPERAFSTACRALLEKLGGEAAGDHRGTQSGEIHFGEGINYINRKSK